MSNMLEDAKKLATNMDDNNNTNINKMPILAIRSLENERIKIEKVEDYYKAFVHLLKTEDAILHNKEHCWIMGVDEYGYSNCIYIVALGGSNMVDASATDVFQLALIKGSKSVILAHNHTHDDILNPSEEDILFTNRVYHMARIIGLVLHDHIIFSSKSLISEAPFYYSFLERNMMGFFEQDISYRAVLDVRHILDAEKEDYAKDYAYEKMLKIIIAMILKNIDIDDIAEITKLSKKKIEQIKDSLTKPL